MWQPGSPSLMWEVKLLVVCFRLLLFYICWILPWHESKLSSVAAAAWVRSYRVSVWRKVGQAKVQHYGKALGSEGLKGSCWKYGDLGVRDVFGFWIVALTKPDLLMSPHPFWDFIEPAINQLINWEFNLPINQINISQCWGVCSVCSLTEVCVFYLLSLVFTLPSCLFGSKHRGRNEVIHQAEEAHWHLNPACLESEYFRLSVFFLFSRGLQMTSLRTVTSRCKTRHPDTTRIICFGLNVIFWNGCNESA